LQQPFYMPLCLLVWLNNAATYSLFYDDLGLIQCFELFAPEERVGIQAKRPKFADELEPLVQDKLVRSVLFLDQQNKPFGATARTVKLFGDNLFGVTMQSAFTFAKFLPPTEIRTQGLMQLAKKKQNETP